MKTKVFVAQEEYRADSYKLLSECYYLPDERLIELLSTLDASKGALCSDMAKHIPKVSDIASLTIDYSKLFVGPYELLAPPYGSVYLEDAKKIMGNSTMDVRNRYMEEELNIGLKEAPDHITIELEFMYYLIFRQVEAIRNSDSARAANYLEKQKAFLETHLGIWAPEFANNVESNAQTEFYKNLARSTKLFVEKDLRGLSGNSILSYEKAGGAR